MNSVALMYVGELGTWGILQPSLLLFLPRNGNQQTSTTSHYSYASPHNPGISHRMSPSFNYGKGISVVPVLQFADNVLCNPTQRVGDRGYKI